MNDYQWYPGHMTKARRQMQEDIKLIDLIIELVDARAPLASRNPDIDSLGQGKARLVIMCKSDLADPVKNTEWTDYFAGRGIRAVSVNVKESAKLKPILKAVEEVCGDKIERDRRRGIKNSRIRAMVAGIPNVGKSTLINGLAGRSAAKTGNKPGVTKGKQWIRLSGTLELLDTPGILWPKFEDRLTGMKLAFLGSINDAILIPEELATDLIGYVEDRYPGMIAEHYGLPNDIPADHNMLEEIGRKRGCLKSKGEIDFTKASGIFVDDFRSGKIGRISLESPNE